ncbi:chorismate mutase [Tilletiaria anomala UBC 951]|uniref:chorismate mutase n=1 Tax=Tilletiaria anomala (strain ATCC 24038 / CBS 436.72 / UBC 951) TaxID=1037660 RepID=A0A066W0P6_TILAU|nr:chorismate mutase [Tilletiaria anomala UBC 951]KDN47542.1 chorismate mutase [Tilletiaria anomala UBC 951]
MPHTLNLTSSPAASLLSLSHIRSVLQRLEDTIVFQLIERAQFKLNRCMYLPGAFPELTKKEGWEGSWTEWFLKESESAHAKVRRWEAPDEYPFTPVELLPSPILPAVEYPPLLWPSNNNHGINVNSKIYSFYVENIVPAICSRHKVEGGAEDAESDDESDDGQYGSAAVRDVEILSALSRRIHFGMFVSESKFRSAPSDFVPHIITASSTSPSVTAEQKTVARDKLLALITKPAVEAALLVRLAEKAQVYGGDFDAAFQARNSGMAREQQEKEREKRRKIEVDEVVQLYKGFVIPLTKTVEVDYLEKRLEGLSESQVRALADGKSWEDVAQELK